MNVVALQCYYDFQNIFTENRPLIITTIFAKAISLLEYVLILFFCADHGDTL